MEIIMIYFKKKYSITLIMLILIYSVIGTTQAVVLDTFDYGVDNFNNSYDLGDAANDTWTIFNINPAGGDVKYTVTLTGETNTIKTENSIGGALGELSISTDVTASMTALLSYGAFDGTPAGPLDLTFGGIDDTFYFDVIRSEAAGFTTTVSVFYLDAFLSPAVSVISFSTTLVTSLERHFLSFSSFTGADFTKVLGVDVSLAGIAGADLTVGEFGTIPEPTTLAILGLGLMAIVFRRKV